MYRVASVTAFDVMESVHVSCIVKLWDGIQTGHPTSELTFATQIQGVGSAEDREWLRDALVGLLECL